MPLLLCAYSELDISLPRQPSAHMNHQAMEVAIVTYLRGWDQYFGCLLITISQYNDLKSVVFSIKTHRGDVLCIAQEDEDGCCLAGRIIQLQRLNYDMVHDWLSACDELHTSRCWPTWAPKPPDFTLLDVVGLIVKRAR